MEREVAAEKKRFFFNKVAVSLEKKRDTIAGLLDIRKP